MKTKKPLFFIAAATVLAFSPIAKTATPSNAQTTNLACNLQQWNATSPLKEDLNFTKGSGRGSDISIANESANKARLGNLHFSSAAGDEINFNINPDGTSTYTFLKSGTDITFNLKVYRQAQASGKYGNQKVPSEPTTAQLTYTSKNQSTPKALATFNCY
jgi:hypothetical protein